MKSITSLFLEKKEHRLAEGITHIEDLNIQKFLATIKNLYNFYATEKMDGAELVFGFDESMKFFTSRAEKGRDIDPKYNSKSYSDVAAYNGFRAAHDALSRLFRRHPKIKNIFHPGDKVEVEVIFGSQPNVITYSNDGKNFIVILRPIPDTMDDDRFEEFQKAVDKIKTNSVSKVIDSLDGFSLTDAIEDHEWIVISNKRTKISNEVIDQSKVAGYVRRLEHFLKQKNSLVSRFLGRPVTNFEVLTSRSITRSTTDTNKDSIQREKETLNQQVLVDFKLPIKKELFDDLLSKGRLSAEEMGGILDGEMGTEGFVLSDGKEQVKLVDRDLFTTINEFNYKVRNELTGTIMSASVEDSIEARGGVLGVCKSRIADLFDIPDLAKISKAKKVFQSYMGDTPIHTVDNFSKSLKISDVGMFVTKVSAIIQDTLEELDERLEKFKEEKDQYEISLKNGEKVKMTDEAKKRTLVTFAEIQTDLEKIKSKIKKVKSVPDLILAIYGNIIQELHDHKSLVSESFNSILLEDDGSVTTSTAMGDSSPLVGSTRAGAIASVPKRLFGGKMIRRIQRTFVPRSKRKSTAKLHPVGIK